jgi:hypothetical protein
MFEQAEKNQGKLVGTPSSFLVDMTLFEQSNENERAAVTSLLCRRFAHPSARSVFLQIPCNAEMLM